jgi:hypothetical protein
MADDWVQPSVTMTKRNLSATGYISLRFAALLLSPLQEAPWRIQKNDLTTNRSIMTDRPRMQPNLVRRASGSGGPGEGSKVQRTVFATTRVANLES